MIVVKLECLLNGLSYLVDNLIGCILHKILFLYFLFIGGDQLFGRQSDQILTFESVTNKDPSCE